MMTGQKGTADAAARENKTEKMKEDVFGCGEGGAREDDVFAGGV